MLGILEVATDSATTRARGQPGLRVHASKFTGKIDWVQLDVGTGETPFISPEECLPPRVVRLRPRWWGDDRPAPSPRSRRTIAGSGHATMAPASCERVTVSFSTA